MSLLQICQWLNDTAPATALRESDLAFPIVESVHVLAIALMAGTVSIVDLRLLGVLLKKEPVTQVAGQVLRLTWAGFAIMAVTGIMLFAAEAEKLYANPAFRIKLVLLALAGLNPLIFHSTIYRTVGEWDDASRTPRRARIAAFCSLTLWTAIILTGRAIAYWRPAAG
jgi:hypothetical protein